MLELQGRKVFLALGPTDMRKAAQGLSIQVENQLEMAKSRFKSRIAPFTPPGLAKPGRIVGWKARVEAFLEDIVT